MINKPVFRQLIKTLNALDLIGISVMLLLAFGLQFLYKDPPCPLCLLQRLGFLAMGFGYLLNMHYRPRPLHYGLSLLASVYTGFVSLRQITLHVLPDSGSYGQPIFDLHLYTWAFVISVLAIIYNAIILSIPYQYMRPLHDITISESKAGWQRTFAHFAFVLFFALMIANVLNVYLECGLNECPDNPVGYVHHLW